MSKFFFKKTVAVYMHTHIIMNHKVEIVQEVNSLFIFPLLWECIIYVIAIFQSTANLGYVKEHRSQLERLLMTRSEPIRTKMVVTDYTPQNRTRHQKSKLT